MTIEEKVAEIVGCHEHPIIVLKGFGQIELPKQNKYFSFEIDYYDTVDLEILEQQAIDEIIDHRNFDEPYLWMTIEEFQLLYEQRKLVRAPIVILQNNLYEKKFPYRRTLSNVDEIYKELYFQEDIELDSEQQKILKNVSTFYGAIDYSKQSGSYFVTYPESGSHVEMVNLYEYKEYPITMSENARNNDGIQIELSEDELPFLDVTAELLATQGTQKQHKNIVFILSESEDLLPNNYLSRIGILEALTQVTITFAETSIRRNYIANGAQYLEILNEVYGFSAFKELEFYKKIKDHSKDIIKISQAQIIDDIVTQAEAAMRGEDFRDIYITASTGAGKSIMFQLPALYLANKHKEDKPLTLVISPLIGLMNDQVSSMHDKGIENSATINGNTPPYEKSQILDSVQNQKVDVLYLSPETLQARSDIKMLIGDRHIGVVIVDEAHIVTTWGKSFRSDYWYLGIYLAKLRKEYKFPIVTFTATAIYGGKEDMYLDTRNSLNMISPISYFGKVRRDDIQMIVRNSEKALDKEGRDYRKTKNALGLKHLQRAYRSKTKSLIYFPTVRLLNEFYSFVNQNEPDLIKVTGKYYGTLRKEEKDEVLREFKAGELEFVLATKAFGMGIDIPDITTVYHYAPTGNVVDYIQEIGRAARDKEKVPFGYAQIDFLSKDMNEVKQLHGMSAIRKTQIIDVMKKIRSLYYENGNNRNLIISPEDFKYIFVQNKRDEDSLDNKIKTVLLMIEKDFASPNKLGYSPFVARPRSLFGNDLILVTKEKEEMFIKSRLGKFFEKETSITSKNYTAVYKVNLSGIWEKYYKEISYPNFKYSLFRTEECEKLKHHNIFKNLLFASGVEVNLQNEKTKEDIIAGYQTVFNAFENFINKFKLTDSQFTVKELGIHFMQTLKIQDKFEARAFAQTIINSAFEFTKIKEIPFIKERPNSREGETRYIIQKDIDLFKSFIMNALKNAIMPDFNYHIEGDKIITFHFRNRVNEVVDAKIAALGIGEALGWLSYQVIGGDNPQIYVRMNSVNPLEKAIKEGSFYKNSILQDVQTKHYTSVEMLKYLFTKEQPEKTAKERMLHYTPWFWTTIEDYFMGVLPNEVKEKLINNS